MSAFQWDKLGHLPTYLRSVPARTDQPVAVDRGRFAAGQVGELPLPAGDDLDGVEHLRQNRLKRWQTPLIPTRKATP